MKSQWHRFTNATITVLDFEAYLDAGKHKAFRFRDVVQTIGAHYKGDRFLIKEACRCMWWTKEWILEAEYIKPSMFKTFPLSASGKIPQSVENYFYASWMNNKRSVTMGLSGFLPPQLEAFRGCEGYCF